MPKDLNDRVVDEALDQAHYEGWYQGRDAGYEKVKEILAEAAPPRPDQKTLPEGLDYFISCANADEANQAIIRDLLKSPNAPAISAWLRVAIRADDHAVNQGAATICFVSPEAFALFFDDLVALTKTPDDSARRDVYSIFAEYEAVDPRVKAIVDRALAEQPLEIAIAAACKRYSGGDRRPELVQMIVAGLRNPAPIVCRWGCLAIARSGDPIISVAELFGIARRKDVEHVQNSVLKHFETRRDPEAVKLAVSELKSDRYELHQFAGYVILRTRLRLDRSVVDLLRDRYNNRRVYERAATLSRYEDFQDELEHAPGALRGALLEIAGPEDHDVLPILLAGLEGYGPDYLQRTFTAFERMRARDAEVLARLLALSQSHDNPTVRECARKTRATLETFRD
ncbi:MAG TPA: hypothetical protein VGE52_01745 [Pirellulales bacterium]